MDMVTFLYVLLLSAGFLAVLYIPHIKTGLNLMDEGYLWYGSLKVLDGAVPIRDFRAYDPGRYYWCGLWMWLFGRGLLSLRISALVAGLLGLAIGTSAVFLVTQSWLVTIPACCLMTVSLYPPYKQVDIIFPMSSVFIAVMLTGDPAWGNVFLAGIFVCVSLIFGLNHALYAGAGFVLIIAIMLWHGHGPDHTVLLPWYAAGLGIGMMPVLAAFVFIPGLFPSYWRQKVMRVVRRRTTNLALPLPWLWRPTPAHLKYLGKRALIIQAVFTLMPIFFGLVIAVTAVAGPASRLEWAVLAVSAIGLGYLHHAMSRADLAHMTQASSPFLIALVVVLSGMSYGWMVLAVLAALSSRSVYLLFRGLPIKPDRSVVCEQFAAGGTSLRLVRPLAEHLSRIRALVDRHTRPGEPVVFVPTLVTLYPLLKRQSAVYDTFCVYPATAEEERAMIRQIEESGARFALVHNHPQDEREALRFSNTHPQVWQFLHREFVPVAMNGELPADHYAFVKPG